MNTNQIRQLFTGFFADRGHRRVPSSSLIPPPEERTLLFSNAGMNQMKPYFMGMAEPPARRMTSIQKCFRTSDIEEVGDSSHCTFFEMLGNFSVGDYFKAEVIPWAWELLTEPEPKGMGLSPERIWATVFLDDNEAYDLWRSAGIPSERIVRFDESENYWFMIKGGAGPCGPNTEIYYDFGPEVGCGRPDCSPPTHDCGRFLEIWNLVFMSLYQEEDGKTRRPLPMRNVDTGAGLERWAPVYMWQNGVDWQGRPMQWTQPPTIYETDLFRPIIQRVEQLCGVSYDEGTPEQKRAIRVVAEHTRAATFLIADGVTPANDGRGYVLRRLIRRGTSFGQRLKQGQQFLDQTADAVIALMQDEHENLRERADFILQTLRSEETRFSATVSRGEEILRGMVKSRLRHAGSISELVRFLQARGIGSENAADLLAQHGFVAWAPDSTPDERLGEEIAAGAAVDALATTLEGIQEGRGLEAGWLEGWADTISGQELVYLYDTYGMPTELTFELAGEFGLSGDIERFEALMQEQRQRSRAAAKFEGDSERIQTYAELGLHHTEFLGYETTRAFSLVEAIVLDGSTIVRQLTPAMAAQDHRIEVVLSQTPFYAEGGGQVGDRGEIVWPEGRFAVEDTQAVGDGGIVAHMGRLIDGTLSVGDPVEARVEESLRGDIMRNHTGTHILHAALRQVLGTHVRQAGSLVTPDRLRFDFTHLEALSPNQLSEVETLANRVVRDNLTVHIEHKSYEEALRDGALAFFGDKYADVVRVVGVCDIDLHDCFSHELCGGTHVHASGEVGSIIITGETSIGAGLRRIEAVTGRAAAERQRQQEETLSRLSASLLVPQNEIEARIATIRDENDRLRKQLQVLERRLARAEADSVATNATKIGDVSVVVTRVPEVASGDALREVGDGLKSKLGSAVLLLGAVMDGKPVFIAMSTPDVAKRCPAGDVVRAASQAAGGGGGGRPEVAQGGGSDPSKLDAGLAAGRRVIEEKLGVAH